MEIRTADDALRYLHYVAGADFTPTEQRRGGAEIFADKTKSMRYDFDEIIDHAGTELV